MMQFLLSTSASRKSAADLKKSSRKRLRMAKITKRPRKRKSKRKKTTMRMRTSTLSSVTIPKSTKLNAFVTLVAIFMTRRKAFSYILVICRTRRNAWKISRKISMLI